MLCGLRAPHSTSISRARVFRVFRPFLHFLWLTRRPRTRPAIHPLALRQRCYKHSNPAFVSLWARTQGSAFARLKPWLLAEVTSPTPHFTGQRLPRSCAHDVRQMHGACGFPERRHSTLETPGYAASPIRGAPRSRHQRLSRFISSGGSEYRPRVHLRTKIRCRVSPTRTSAFP